MAGHEYAEAATDPQPSSGAYAWMDSGGNAIGDKCAWSSSSTDISYAVQPLWSNATTGCVTSY